MEKYGNIVNIKCFKEMLPKFSEMLQSLPKAKYV